MVQYSYVIPNNMKRISSTGWTDNYVCKSCGAKSQGI